MNQKIILRKILLLPLCFVLFGLLSHAQQPDVTIRKKDRKKDIEMVTTEGSIILRLSDSTPIHRDNFLKLIKSGFYNGVSFHRVMAQFMIQAGDP